MDNINEQKVANNKQDNKRVIKFQIQKNIKNQTVLIHQKNLPYSLWKTNIFILG